MWSQENNQNNNSNMVFLWVLKSSYFFLNLPVNFRWSICFTNNKHNVLHCKKEKQNRPILVNPMRNTENLHFYFKRRKKKKQKYQVFLKVVENLLCTWILLPFSAGVLKRYILTNSTDAYSVLCHYKKAVFSFNDIELKHKILIILL